MKKVLSLFAFSILMSCGLYAAGTESKVSGNVSISPRENESYVDTGGEISAEITLSASAGQVSTITVPSGYKAFCAYPRTNHARFSVQNGSVSRLAGAVGTVSAGASAGESNFGIGGILKNDIWTCRLLPYDGSERYIYLRSTTGSVVVDFELIK